MGKKMISKLRKRKQQQQEVTYKQTNTHHKEKMRKINIAIRFTPLQN